MNKCPGQDFHDKLPELKYMPCPQCKKEVELWPPAYIAKCDQCGCEVRAEGIPTCADWCKYAKECIGEEKYKELIASHKVMPEECCHHHNCIEELRADHEKILAELAKLEANPEQAAKEFLEFTENFAEPHHHKEEEVLFPKLEEKGIPNEGGPIGVMLQEHEIKRAHVRDLREAVANGDMPKARQAAQSIIDLLREHINKENNILYPMAEQVLTPDEMAQMGEKCSKIQGGE